MTHLCRFAFATLGLLFLVQPALAFQEASVETVNVVHGQIRSETGETVDISIPENGGLAITDQETGLSYRLSLEAIDSTSIRILVEQFVDEKRSSRLDSEILDLKLDGSFQGTSLAPFGLSLDKLSSQSRVLGERVAAPGTSSCCVTCGSLKVCCTPAAGWCCTVNSSCGTSCGACN